MINDFTRILLFLSISLNAQVGLGIDNPKTLFHIDPMQNTTEVNNIVTNDNDDLVYTSEGYLGIGKSNPTNQLSIVGNTINPPLNIKNIQNLTTTKTVYNLALDSKSNIGIVSYTKVPIVFFSLLEQTKGLDISNNNSTINLPIGLSLVEFNTAAISFGKEDEINYLSIPKDGIYSIEAVANFFCDTNSIWGVNLIIRKKEINQSIYNLIDSRRIVTKLGNETNSNNNIPLPGKFFGVFSFKEGDKVSIDVGTGFAASGVDPLTCGTHKPGLNTSATNFIIKKIN
ncbi:hypothetical protein HX096_10930 [Empedobacter falsenii]|uniref:hypothetical protein n=1 Tax=Empedobacter falsenii TaxID=343874 RepID=UPI002575345A|nr:hypothetical protein [Empedobacter falsenii]MDM1548366.1 hypothetical protein [Empedobacter falsenii]